VYNKTRTVLLIEDSSDYAQLVRAWLADEEEFKFVLSWADSLREGMNTLAKGGIDLVLLDLGLPDSNGPETFGVISNAARGVPIIVLSGRDNEALALRMVQEGAQDYLVKSSCNSAALKKAIHYAIVRNEVQAERSGSAASPRLAKVVGVIGAKGGVGATTVACNLAVELRRETGQKTLLADLDFDAGLVHFLMNTGAQHTVLDGISNLHHLDLSCWEGIVALHDSGLHIVGSPELMGAHMADGNQVGSLVTLVASFYQWIVLDLGRLNTFSLSLLDKLDELFVVTTTSIPALYEAKRMISALQQAGFEGDRLRIIVNQFGDRSDYFGSELDRLFGIRVHARLPGATQELHEACVSAKQVAGNSGFQGHIARLARKVASLPERPKSRISQIFSLGDKLRKRDVPDSPTRVA